MRKKTEKPHLGFRVAYFGKNYRGFQAQSHSNSVQQEFEKALSIFFRSAVHVEFSSRTDSGVHAWDQIVLIRNGYELYERLSPDKKRRFVLSLNSLLKGEIVIWSVMKLKGIFHPKKHIEWKEYRYYVYEGVSPDPLKSGSHWNIHSALNLREMQRHSTRFLGTHDFSAFASKAKGRERRIDNRRTILEATVEVTKHPRISNLREFCFRFRGDGFLYRMVRNMVALLVEVGRGKSVSVEEVFLKGQMSSKVVSAPAHGLILAKTKIRRNFISKTIVTLLLAISSIAPRCFADHFTGSANFSIHQRFFDDSKLGHVNGFSEWGVVELKATFGLMELPYRLEPIVGFSFIKNSAPLYKLDSAGNYLLDSEGHKMKSEIDALSYQFYTGLVGLRWKAWEPSFFFLIPYLEASHEFRYGRVRKKTYNVDEQKLNTGLDLGFQFGFGLLVSFMVDDRIRSDINSEWSAKDYALMASIHYLPAGYSRSGLGIVDSLGGWDFGGGLFIDW